MAGGVLRAVTLRPPDAAHPRWWFDEGELAAAFGPRTRVVLLNTPHNPTGKVFTAAELELVAALARRWDAVAVVDEVYGHLVYDGAEHRSLADAPRDGRAHPHRQQRGEDVRLHRLEGGLGDGPARAAGRSAPGAPVRDVRRADAAAAGDRHRAPAPGRVLRRAAGGVRPTPGKAASALDTAGLVPWAPEGAYFACVDVAGRGFADDDAFCRDLTTRVGVAAIPLSAFYVDRHAGAVRGTLCLLQGGRDARRGSATAGGGGPSNR